jgi:hypothetical protein
MPTKLGAFGFSSQTLTAATNNPNGYQTAISTNQSSANSHASDLTRQSLSDAYLSTTANSCTWNTNSKTLTNTDNTLLNNTYGFTLNSTNLAAQKLCKIPDSTNPLTVKSTTAANESGDNTTIYFGAKVDLNQTAGDYRTTIIYTALADI